MCGPNRSTGLGQLTADQSSGTRRHAALTADPREPIASIRTSPPSNLCRGTIFYPLSNVRFSIFDDDATIHLRWLTMMLGYLKMSDRISRNDEMTGFRQNFVFTYVYRFIRNREFNFFFSSRQETWSFSSTILKSSIPLASSLTRVYF